MNGQYAGNLKLKFETPEYMALCEIAQKYKTDVASVVRIGCIMLIEAERRGLLKLRNPCESMQAVLSKGDA